MVSWIYIFEYLIVVIFKGRVVNMIDYDSYYCLCLKYCDGFRMNKFIGIVFIIIKIVVLWFKLNMYLVWNGEKNYYILLGKCLDYLLYNRKFVL